jgi:elongator complex protein 3
MVKMTELWPEYVRVTRMYRDIPADTVISGSKISNLRQYVEKKLQEEGVKSRDIRSREIKDQKVIFSDLKLKIQKYEAAGGKEFFISYTYKKQDKLCALLRLRFSSYSLSGRKHFIKELDGAAIIREIHTYGELVNVKKHGKAVSQHIGLGKRMIKEAEEISRKNGFKKIAVISGIGVREYYKKLGYFQEGTYMVKNL